MRHQLAREGYVFPPRLVSTLAGFVSSLNEAVPAANGLLLDLLLQESLNVLSLPAFRAVADRRGFRSALARAMGEMSSAGCASAEARAALDCRGRPVLRDFLNLCEDVERKVAAGGFASRGGLLQLAAERVRAEGTSGIREFFFDGFFNFTQPELGLVAALREKAEVTVTLPDWAGCASARKSLIAMGLEEQDCGFCRRHPDTVLLEAETREREVEEIAARIVELAQDGLPFREIGIVVRQHDPYVPLLRATLERFGIPVRCYFSAPLRHSAMVRCFEALIEAALGGWQHEQTLTALRLMPGRLGNGLAMDQFSWEVMEHLPGSGLEGLRHLAKDPAVGRRLDSLLPLESWLKMEAAPAEWAARFSSLQVITEPRDPPQEGQRLDVLLWREYEAACAGFQAAVEEAASALPAKPIRLGDFWSVVKDAVRLSAYDASDRRRNVVHVMEVHEARQWELTVAFVCGLLERQFPMHHTQDPFLSDDVRRRLREKGWSLPTVAEKDREEEFLFEFSLTRATRTVVLSYPKFGPKGEETLRSFFLDRLPDIRPEPRKIAARLARPVPSRSSLHPREPKIAGDDLLALIAQKHARTSPTAIENFLQCPFLFFAQNTLGLRERPARPEERLDPLVQGSILHRVLELRLREPDAHAGALFDRVFADFCKQERIPQGYRTEAVRLAMLRSLTRFLPAFAVPDARPGLAERRYVLGLSADLTLACQVDRIDTGPDGRKLVIDYKYSSLSSVKQRVKDHREGLRIQGGIYMAVLEQAGERCAGMLFGAMREKPGWAGWLTEGLKAEGVAAVTEEELRQVIEISTKTALAAAGRIRQGEIAPRPANQKHCETCRYRHVCRVESARGVLVAGEAEESWT